VPDNRHEAAPEDRRWEWGLRLDRSWLPVIELQLNLVDVSAPPPMSSQSNLDELGCDDVVLGPTELPAPYR
jgi:hypothetical protein